MILAVAIAAAAAAPVVLVTTPGVRLEGHQTLITALQREGADVVLVSLPCSGVAADHVAAIQRSVGALEDPPVVVAHGLGATLVLMAAADALPARRLVLLGPVLGVPRTEAALSVGRLHLDQRVVDLREPMAWRDTTLQEVLLGVAPGEPLGCVSAPFARQVAGWVAERRVPLDLGAVATPVWIGVGLLDEVAPPEVVVSASRALPARELVRLGITRLDPRDFDHLGLLADPIPARVAAHAATEEAP